MPPSLPNECLSDVLAFLDKRSLYKCLFVNRFYCKLSIPIIWMDPFNEISPYFAKKSPLINTLLACLNEDEISSLIPCAINFNNQPLLFEYGKFVRRIVHGNCINHIVSWLKSYPSYDQDCRVRKLINVIYHMIMRQGSNLQEFIVNNYNYIDLPKFSVFTTYKPGITNLRSFEICVDLEFEDTLDKFQNTVEFLSMVSNFCNSIVNCELWIDNGFPYTALLDFIKLQPLERIIMYFSNYSINWENVKKIIYALEFRSETLRELSFDCLNFQGIDLSFLSKLEYLELLEFRDCVGFTFYEGLSKKKLHLKELVWYCDMKMDMINSFCSEFCSEELVKLSLTITTPEIIKLVKESCPNISHLRINGSEICFDSTIPLICELSSLRILYISNFFEGEQVRILGDYLTSVKYLYLSFHIQLSSFEYFANNCKANLEKWIINLDNKSLRKDYLICVNNFQKVHNSLKVLGINQSEVVSWTDEELGIIDSLKNQGINIILSDDDYKFSILLKLFV